MLRLAYRNFSQNRARLIVSTGGVALALMLVLSLDAIFAGVERQIVAYILNSGADIFVSQAGVRNMHMASSSLPSSVVQKVAALPEVQSATPVLYLTNMVVLGEERNLAYVIGLPAGAEAGAPWRLVQGVAIPSPGEAVIDRSVAATSGVGVGDKARILGREFTIVGLSDGTRSLVNSVAFISAKDFAELRGDAQTVSFVLVRVRPGQRPEEVAARIEAEVGGVTAQSSRAFAEQEQRVVRDMSTDVITIMNLAGFLIGIAVMALTVYVATIARRAEYGVLKALGARNGHLFRAVLAQALYSVALGFALGLAFTWLLAAIVPQLGLGLALAVKGTSLLKVAGVSLAIAGISAILPVIQIAGLDPAAVYRGGKGK